MAKEEQDWREEARERFKEKQSKGRFKLVEGENTLRILPRVKTGKKGSNAPFYEYLVHREVGPNKRYVRCGKTLHGDGECWLCDVKIKELQDSGESAKEKRAAALAPKEQFVVQVAAIDQDTDKMRGPFLWTVPTGGARSLAARLLGVLKSTKRDYVDAEEGYNFTIERTGTGKTDTQYGQIVADEEASAVPKKILAASKPFSSYVPGYSEEQQKAAYFGRDAREEEEEEDEPKKKKGRSEEDEEESESEEAEEEEDTPKKKKHSEEEEEEEEPDEEEEKPKKKKGKHSEEEEEETEEEEEAEEKPKKKGKKSEEEEEEETEEGEEEEEESKPKKKKHREEEEEEETEPDEEEERPKKKKKPAEEEEEETEEEEADEDDKPKKKKGKKHSEEEEEEPDEEEERPAKKKKKPSHDDD